MKKKGTKKEKKEKSKKKLKKEKEKRKHCSNEQCYCTVKPCYGLAVCIINKRLLKLKQRAMQGIAFAKNIQNF